MQKCFEYSKEILKGCHIIYFPDNVLGDENHHLMPAKNSDHRLERNAMNFCFEVMMDSLNNDDSLFFKYVRSLRGKDIAVLSSADRAGQIFSKAAESSGANVVFLSSKAKLQLLTDEEFAQCQQCDVVISCDVHGVKTHIYNGIKCLNIWDILRDRSLTDNLPSSIVNCE